MKGTRRNRALYFLEGSDKLILSSSVYSWAVGSGFFRFLYKDESNAKPVPFVKTRNVLQKWTLNVCWIKSEHILSLASNANLSDLCQQKIYFFALVTLTLAAGEASSITRMKANRDVWLLSPASSTLTPDSRRVSFGEMLGLLKRTWERHFSGGNPFYSSKLPWSVKRLQSVPLPRVLGHLESILLRNPWNEKNIPRSKTFRDTPSSW